MRKVIGANMPVNFICDSPLSSGGRARGLGAVRVWLPVLQSIVPHRLPAARHGPATSGGALPGGAAINFRGALCQGVNLSAARGLKVGKKKRKNVKAGCAAGGRRCKSHRLQVRGRSESSTQGMSCAVRVSAPGTRCHHCHTCPFAITENHLSSQPAPGPP